MTKTIKIDDDVWVELKNVINAIENRTKKPCDYNKAILEMAAAFHEQSA